MALLLKWHVSVCVEGKRQVWSNTPFEIGSSKSLRHNFLTRTKVTLFSMSLICKQRSIANDWKLMQGMKVISKKRRKNLLLETFGVDQFLEFLIFLAPAL